MINNYQKGMIEIHKIQKLGIRPKLLLHACCGPCAAYPIEFLSQFFDITIFFNNSNIYPNEEYQHRLSELKRYVEFFNKKNKKCIEIIEVFYNNEEYMKTLSIRKDDKENGPRCKLCYVIRMKQAYEYAVGNHYDYFSTVMSMSRQKDEQIINKVGRSLERMYPSVKFLPHNFKKKGGQERREEIVNELNLYDQIYCGCIYSYKEMINKNKK